MKFTKKDLTERSRIDFDTRESAFESSDIELDFATLMQAKVDRTDPFRSTEPTNRPKSMTFLRTMAFIGHSDDLKEGT